MKRPEQEIHKAVVQHLRTRAVPGLVWWHTPNGARYSSPAQGRIMSALGARAGVSDFILVHAGKLFALELKAPGGRASVAQMKFLSDIDAAGAFTAMPEGLDAALATLESWGLLKENLTMAALAKRMDERAGVA
jgi:hypothetical protein